MVSWGVNFPHKSGPITSWLAPPPFDNFKIPSNLYTLPSPINMTAMIRQNTVSSCCQIPQVNLITRLFTAPQGNFGPLSKGRVINPVLITVLDTYLTPRSPGAWMWAETLLILNVVPSLTSPWIWPINI